MDRNGSLMCAAQSLPMRIRRQDKPPPRSRRSLSKRSRTASVTASVKDSPVTLASCLAMSWVSLFLIFRPNEEPFYHHCLVFYHIEPTLCWTAQPWSASCFH